MLSTHHKVLYSCPLDLLGFTRAVKRLADVVMGLRLMYLRCFDLTMNAVGLALVPPPCLCRSKPGVWAVVLRR